MLIIIPSCAHGVQPIHILKLMTHTARRIFAVISSRFRVAYRLIHWLHFRAENGKGTQKPRFLYLGMGLQFGGLLPLVEAKGAPLVKNIDIVKFEMGPMFPIWPGPITSFAWAFICMVTYVYMAGEGLWNSPPGGIWGGSPLQVPNCGNPCPPCKLT